LIDRSLFVLLCNRTEADGGAARGPWIAVESWDKLDSVRKIANPLVLALCLAAGGGAALGQGGGNTYRVGPKDLIEIQVLQVPELNVERRVSEDGKVSLPLIGDFDVDGLTESEIRLKLKTLLESRYMQQQQASVSVLVKEVRSRPISVIGAVKQPGPLAFPGRWTLLEALTAAGGLAPDHGETVYVLRRAANGLTDQVGISLDDLLLAGDPRANVPIFANDLINVPAATTVTVFFVGEVRTPGAVAFKSTDRITMLTALARAGGLTDRAARKVVIRRAAGREQEIEVDARRILSGKDPDVELLDGDVVVVKEAFF
jgi:polysaccharide export outer membrane protein